MKPEESSTIEESRVLKPLFLKFPSLGITLVFQWENQEDCRIGKKATNNFLVKNKRTNKIDAQAILEGLEYIKKNK